MTSLCYKFMMAILYELQITASCYVIMMTSDVIKFIRMTNPLMMPTFNGIHLTLNIQLERVVHL